MKNYFIIILTLMISVNLSAQTDQGNKFINLSSSLSYTSQTVDAFGTKYSSSIFLFDSYVGYFVVDNLAATASLTYSGISGTSSASISIGGRYYIQKFYAGCDLALDEITLRLNAGYPIFISRNIAIEPSISYSKVSESTSSLSMFVGFAMYF